MPFCRETRIYTESEVDGSSLYFLKKVGTRATPPLTVVPKNRLEP